MRIQKDILTVVILRELHEPLPRSLGDIAEFIDSGAGIGCYSLQTSVEVPAERLTDELLAVGNDGTFFDSIQEPSE